MHKPRWNFKSQRRKGEHDHTIGHGGPVPNNWHNRPRLAMWHDRATWHSCAIRHGQTVPLGRPVGCSSLSWPNCTSQHGTPMLNPWDFRAILRGLFCGFKLASLALLSAKYRPSFRFFDKVPENTERCYMSKMCAKGGRIDFF